MPGMDGLAIFAGSSGKAFAEKICHFVGIGLSRSQIIHFSEGNTYVKACDTVRGLDVFLVQPIGLKPNDEFVEILFWADAFKRASARTVTAIIPYFSYAKADKKDEPRVSIRARVCADCLEVAGIDRVVTMDLHSPQIQGFFKKPVDNLYGLPILGSYVKTLMLPDLVVVSPDAGFAKTARKYAELLNASLAVGDKIRQGHDEKAEICEVIGAVQGKNALIVDDFTLSGGTLIKMATALKERGTLKVFVAVTHLLLDEKAVKRVENSPIDLLIGMDTVDNPALNSSSKVKVISAAPLIGEALIRIQRRESLSSLFTNVNDRVLAHSW